MTTNSKEYARNYSRKFYNAHKLAGLCIDCNEPACEDNIRCAKHRDVSNSRRRKKYNETR